MAGCRFSTRERRLRVGYVGRTAADVKRNKKANARRSESGGVLYLPSCFSLRALSANPTLSPQSSLTQAPRAVYVFFVALVIFVSSCLNLSLRSSAFFASLR
jgi:hypothetical protein